MLDVNADMAAHMHEHPLWERVTLQPGAHSTEPQTIHVSHALGRVRRAPPGIAPQVPGGILAEEMGLGAHHAYVCSRCSVLSDRWNSPVLNVADRWGSVCTSARYGSSTCYVVLLLLKERFIRERLNFMTDGTVLS